MNKYFLLLLVIFSINCAGPQKSLDNKNYDKAYRLSLKELKKNKSPAKNQRILSEALSYIIDGGYDKISELTKSNYIEDWEKAVKVNRDIQDKILEASKYLGNQNERSATDLEEKELAMMESIYEVYFQDGKDKLEEAVLHNNKILAQKAYFDLVKAKEYNSVGSLELDSLIGVSLKRGVIYHTIEIDAPFSISFHWEIDRRFDDIENLSSRFVNISFESNYNKADCVIEVEFDRLDFYYDESSDQRDFEEEVITGYNTVVDSSGNSSEVPIYERVQGTVFIITRVKTAKWDIRVDVNSKTSNCNLSSSYFDANIESVIEDIQIQGDDRAIPNEYRNYSREEFLSDDDMGEALIDVIYDEVIDRLF